MGGFQLANVHLSSIWEVTLLPIHIILYSHKKKYSQMNMTQTMNLIFVLILDYENGLKFGPNYRKDNLATKPNYQKMSVFSVASIDPAQLSPSAASKITNLSQPKNLSKVRTSSSTNVERKEGFAHS